MNKRLIRRMVQKLKERRYRSEGNPIGHELKTKRWRTNEGPNGKEMMIKVTKKRNRKKQSKTEMENKRHKTQHCSQVSKLDLLALNEGIKRHMSKTVGSYYYFS